MEQSNTSRINRKLNRIYNELFWLRRRFFLKGDKEAVQAIDVVRNLIIRNIEEMKDD